RTRRVKCDETRPNCKRCVRAGFNCDGYPLDRSTTPTPPPTTRLLIPRASANKTSQVAIFTGNTILCTPWRSICNDEVEYRYFDYFRTSTIECLTDFFGTGIWGGLILQLCHQQSFARHAVIALAALHKATLSSASMLVSTESFETHQAALKEHNAYALKQYASSLSDMRQMTLDESDKDTVRNALVSCLLTTTFESFHGNRDLALGQAAMGIKVLGKFIEHMKVNQVPNDENNSSMDEELVLAFVRLETTVRMFLRAPKVPGDSFIDCQEEE
ncbi:hypothetical protein BGZ60DRAFT_538124, partial [Tricladium varicosporioides]